MDKIRLYIQSLPITLESWFISFLGIVIIRIFFEQLSSFTPGHFVLIDLSTIIHYSTFFLAITISSVFIFILFTKISIREALSNSIFGLFLIWIVPIVDLISGGVGGHTVTYLFVTGKELLIRYLTFFHGHTTSGATLGIQIEIGIAVIMSIIYTFSITKNLKKSILIGFVFYSLVFLFLSIPSIMSLFINSHNNVATSISNSINSSHIIENNINPNWSTNRQIFIELAFNKIMTGVFTIIIIISTFFLFLKGERKKLLAVLKNGRSLRIICYVLMFIFGSSLSSTKWLISWIDIQTYILAIISIVNVWMFCVLQNDIHDQIIDQKSNPDRPLITGELSVKDMEIASKIFLIFTFLSAYASSNYMLFFTTMFLCAYYIYSNPPLRIKRFTIFSSFLISLACLALILSGYFFKNIDKSISSFPLELILIIIALFTVISNIRDIKDIDGDRIGKINTIPVLIGLNKSKKVIAFTTCIPLFFSPIYFNSKLLIIPAMITTLLSWKFITAKDYKEWKVFSLYIIYFTLIIILLFLK